MIMMAVLGLLAAGGFLLVRYLASRPAKDQDAKPTSLRAIDLAGLQTLLDPGEEKFFRSRLNRNAFHNWQRKRLLVVAEYLSRMEHNALVLLHWANLEAQFEIARGSLPQREVSAQAVVEAATRFRVYCWYANVKLRLWMTVRLDLLFMLPAPSLSSLRQIGGINAFSAYERLREAAAGMGSLPQPEAIAALSARL